MGIQGFPAGSAAQALVSSFRKGPPEVGPQHSKVGAAIGTYLMRQVVRDAALGVRPAQHLAASCCAPHGVRS